MAIPMPLRDAHGLQLPPQFDAQGKPYFVLDNGQKRYLAPAEAAQMAANDPGSDPRLAQAAAAEGQAPGAGFVHGAGYWDPTTGTWKQKLNGAALVSAGVGAAIGAPFVAGALGAGGGTATAGGSTIADAAPSSGLLASTATPGMSLLPSVGASGVGTGASAGGILGGVKDFLTGGFGSSGNSILGTAGKIGEALTGLEAGRANGRSAQITANQAQDRNQIAATQVNLGAGAKRASQAVRGDILANAHDFSYGAPTMVGNIPVPSSTGGLRPSIFSSATRQLGGELSSDALNAQTADQGNPVQLTPLPQSNALDSILGTAATIGNLGSLGSRIPSTLPPRRPYDPNNPNAGGY